MRTILATLFAVHFIFAAIAGATEPTTNAPAVPQKDPGNPIIIIETSMGEITAELWPDEAPETVANFLKYVDSAFYDGLVFHRVIDGFMIQGGGFSETMRQKATRKPIKNEARKDGPNSRGTLAMARTMAVNSATSQFFINLVDNVALNHRNTTPRGYGYCTFGKITAGMDIVDAIGKVKTGRKMGFGDVPLTPVVILSIKRAESKTTPDALPDAAE